MTTRHQRGTHEGGMDNDDAWDDFDDFIFDELDEWEPEPKERAKRRARHERPERDQTAEGWWVRFAREYGWRAYAIPVLSVITVFVLINMVQNPDAGVVTAAGTDEVAAQDGDATNGEHGAHEHDGWPQRELAEMPEAVLDVNHLPPGGPFTESGTGNFTVIGQPGAAGGVGEELTVRYVVEVEEGIDTALYGGPDAVSAMVDSTLLDPRSWTNDPRFRLEHVAPEDNPTLRIRLASVNTTRELCGGELGLETSCRTRITGEDTVVINESRWVRGAAPFEGDLGSYRQYVINHEVGHALGFARHEQCPADGALAPIMMQQTLSLNNSQLRSFDPGEVYEDNNDTCRYNPWPYPRPAVL
ncbi:DUF3152 domain-containing protein [Corynebacterium riegelii]